MVQMQRGSHQPDSFSVSRLLQDTMEEIKGERLLKVNKRNSKPSVLQDNNKTFNCQKEVSWEVGLSVTSASLVVGSGDIKLITFLTCDLMKDCWTAEPL